VFKCVMRRPTNGNAATRLQGNSTLPQSGLEDGLYDAQSQCCTQYTYNIIAFVGRVRMLDNNDKVL